MVYLLKLMHITGRPEKQVSIIPWCEKFLKCCRKRGNAWTFKVQDRLHGRIDLVAVEAVYHTS